MSSEDLVLSLLEQRRASGTSHGRRAAGAASASVSSASLLQEQSSQHQSPLAASGLNDTQVARIQQLLQEHSVKRVGTSGALFWCLGLHGGCN